jgi:omega-amidase
MKARAVDSQIYMAAVSPARDEKGPYICYGYSKIIDPWGKEIAAAKTKEAVITAEIDTEYADDIRRQLPLLKHRKRNYTDGFFACHKKRNEKTRLGTGRFCSGHR